MIVTLTANPSIDRTISLTGPLTRGAVLRAGPTLDQPGGKGVNVARVLAGAGVPARAILPADPSETLLTGIDGAHLTVTALPRGGPARVNLTLAEPDGTTTKINSPGPELSADRAAALLAAVVEAAREARWAVLSGSLAEGMAAHWYAGAVRALRPTGVRIAVDTSDAPLRALGDALPGAAPDLLKPNDEELAQLTGTDPRALQAAAHRGEPGPLRAAAEELLARGVGAGLITLGAAGAMLALGGEHPQVLWAQSPPVTARSTVGAGDSSLAGYLAAESVGADPAIRLATAVAYGAAAVSLPGTTLPTPADADPLISAVRVDRIDPSTGPARGRTESVR